MALMRKMLPLLLLPLFSTATAAPIRYDFSGTCRFECSGVGLASGAAVSGFIEAADGFAADGVLTASELVGFGFTFGNFVVGPGFSATGLINVGSDLSLLTGGLTFVAPNRFASTGLIGGAAFGSSFQGWAVTQTFQVGGFPLTVPLAGGPGGYSNVSEVPEPGTLALLGLGLAAIALTRRRRVLRPR